LFEDAEAVSAYVEEIRVLKGAMLLKEAALQSNQSPNMSLPRTTSRIFDSSAYFIIDIAAQLLLPL
jgi:hypothetical protein